MESLPFNDRIIDTARVLMTMKCNRSCLYCCNKEVGILDSAIETSDFNDFAKYDTICLSGGEPMLNPTMVIEWIYKIRYRNPEARILLYTALYHPLMEQIIPLVDGIQYSLHVPLNGNDVDDFASFQADIALYGLAEQSFRLYVESSINYDIPIIPALWKRIEIKPFMKSCSLPKNERLFIWKNK